MQHTNNTQVVFSYEGGDNKFKGMTKLSRKMSIEKQDVAIQLEYERLRQTLSGISAADNLIQRCAFMTITLQILEDEVKSNGPTILMHNGKQTMRVENPAQKSYNTMINRYTAAMDKLLSLLPRESAIMPADPNKESDGFDDFVEERGE